MKAASARAGSVVAPRNRRGERFETTSVTATHAKKEFGRILETAIRGGAVVITKHDAPKAVLISVDEFNGFSRPAKPKLDTLTAYFDTLLDQMQGPKARAAMQAAFDASPEELGKAAVAGARRRR
jgi:antitoxin Phd